MSEAKDGGYKNRLTVYPEKVLPETIREAITGANIVPSASEIITDLNAHRWQAGEIRDQRLPACNVYYVTSEQRDLPRQIGNRLAAILEILGYESSDYQYFPSIYIDPSVVEYTDGAKAYYTAENGIWIKSADVGRDADVELAHGATLSIFPDKGADVPVLAAEGISTWLESEVRERRGEVIPPYSYRSSTGIWGREFKESEISVNMDIDPGRGEYIGGLLFDVIYEKLGNNSQKLGCAWKTIENYSSISEWLDAIGKDYGFSSVSIEAAWKKKLFEPTRPTRKIIQKVRKLLDK